MNLITLSLWVAQMAFASTTYVPGQNAFDQIRSFNSKYANQSILVCLKLDNRPALALVRMGESYDVFMAEGEDYRKGTVISLQDVPTSKRKTTVIKVEYKTRPINLTRTFLGGQIADDAREKRNSIIQMQAEGSIVREELNCYLEARIS